MILKPFELKKITLASALTLAATLPVSQDADAFCCYVKLDDINGESMATGHKGEIDILSWSWGTSSKGNKSHKSKKDPGRLCLSEVRILKEVDAATPQLQEALTSGRPLRALTLTVPESLAEPSDYLQYEFHDLLITSYQSNQGDRGERPVEEIAFNYTEVAGWYSNDAGTGGSFLVGPNKCK